MGSYYAWVWGGCGMKLSEIIEIAKQHQIRTARMKKAELVCAIQLAEGNEPCFASGKASVCGQEMCLWREDCD